MRVYKHPIKILHIHNIAIMYNQLMPNVETLSCVMTHGSCALCKQRNPGTPDGRAVFQQCPECKSPLCKQCLGGQFKAIGFRDPSVPCPCCSSGIPLTWMPFEDMMTSPNHRFATPGDAQATFDVASERFADSPSLDDAVMAHTALSALTASATDLSARQAPFSAFIRKAVDQMAAAALAAAAEELEEDESSAAADELEEDESD